MIASAGRPPPTYGTNLRARWPRSGGALPPRGPPLRPHAHVALSAWTAAALPRHARRRVHAVSDLFLPPRSVCSRSKEASPPGYRAAPRLGAAWLSVALCAGPMAVALEFQIWARCRWCGDALHPRRRDGARGHRLCADQDRHRRYLGYSTVEHARVILVALGVASSATGASANSRRGRDARGHPDVFAHNLAKTWPWSRWTASSRPPDSAASTPSVGWAGWGPSLPWR